MGKSGSDRGKLIRGSLPAALTAPHGLIPRGQQFLPQRKPPSVSLALYLHARIRSVVPTHGVPRWPRPVLAHRYAVLAGASPAWPPVVSRGAKHRKQGLRAVP